MKVLRRMGKELIVDIKCEEAKEWKLEGGVKENI